jgi:hexosaminidase
MRCSRRRGIRTAVVLLSGLTIIASCTADLRAQKPFAKAAMGNIIPVPVSVTPSSGAFGIRPDTRICAEPDSAGILAVGRYFVDKLKPATGYDLGIAAVVTPAANTILLTMNNADKSLGKEGYLLTVTSDRVVLSANTAAGLFYGVQTILQMLPAKIFSASVQQGPWNLAAGTIRDMPRFAWRGAMLDVARSFFTVENVKHFIDLMALYKLNSFHFHLTDDQGWRIEIKSWPRLATQGSDNSVTGCNKGFYTQQQYSDIVKYAQARFITVIPEIDMPGHINAALSCYGELNPDNIAKAPYSGIDVGFSSLAIDKEITYKFADDVIRELCAITPGPYFHIGADEAKATPDADYVRFVERARSIIESHGKRMIGWGEVAKIKQAEGVVAQHWKYDTVELAKMAVDKGAKLIMSPANKAYLDMKYVSSTALGQDWAGIVEVKDSYGWDPADLVSGVTESSILGVEAPLWSETLRSMNDVEYMALPRLAGIAEIGWSSREGRNWDEYRLRLASHGRRWTAMGVNFYKSPQVRW